jgi:hypothetical protein
MVLLWGRPLASWLLALGEHDGHEDLHGSGRWSVIPYIHGRMELYYSSLPCLSLPFRPTFWKWHLPGSFIAQGQVIYNEPQGPTGGPRGR